MISHSRIILAALGALAASATPALAQPAVATDSAVFVERITDGSTRRLEPARKFAPGDRVVTVVSWYRMGGDGSFTITNPLPASVSYEESAVDGQEVSVDGGRNWGQLGSLRVGARMATPEDVTHVRWRITATRASRGRGQIAYSGIVR